jgi:hypothetical protein
MAQADGPDAPIAPKQAIGGIEILQAMVAVAAALPLREGMDAAHPWPFHRELAEGITADPHPPIPERYPGLAGSAHPELQVG